VQNTIKIGCNISASDFAVPLGMEIWLDDQLIFDQKHVAEITEFTHELSDDDAEHELRFVLKNKAAEHTVIDQEGNIIKDACLIISDLTFDRIQLGHMFIELATYSHDFNGTGNKVQDKFYGTMGCNGTVSLRFNTPIYLWLLENM
jgi:hypothetical protein